MSKTADTDHPIHSLLAERWSPRAFSDEPVSSEQLGSILEAARWAPSCYNEQPWRFVVATRSDAEGFERRGFLTGRVDLRTRLRGRFGDVTHLLEDDDPEG